ncbi:TonB-dependent receptor [Marinilabiliaceae bacterium A049]|nr:TonB-dependent receptor [Marinilabiliaceae bacterium A049]
MLACIFPLFAQTNIVGKIYDESTSDPLIGAAIQIKDSQTGTITNEYGEFTLETDKALPVTLVLSYLGYTTNEIEINTGDAQVIYLKSSSTSLNEFTVTSRRRQEELQKVPIPIAVIGVKEIGNSVSFNVNRIKELVPSVQLYSSNPRNTTLNIRGLGSTFGLTNDGIDPGVGFYVDGVYYARPAATTLDFIDVKQIEVIRGQQGTLFGKNTTAGTFNITSKLPSFENAATFEQSFGNYGFIQTKSSVTGPIIKDLLAMRISFSGTQRDGTIYNTATEKFTNTLNNQGVRCQFLYIPQDKFKMIFSADFTRQRPDGYAQVFAGVAPTQRAEFRQFENIIADLNYHLPSQNPFDRIIDHDTPWSSNQDMGGITFNIDREFTRGTLTATTAWRYWHWDPSNDRDFTGLSAIARSQAPSFHNQYSQEIRYAGDFNNNISGVIGLFAFYQQLRADGAHILEAGSDQWRFVQDTQDPLWQTPGLLDGYTQETKPGFNNFSGALFGQLEWNITEKLSILPGLRLNYDMKEVDFERTVSGGLETDNPDLIKLQRKVFKPLSFQTNTDDWNLSGNLTLKHQLLPSTNLFGTYSLGFKPVGLNLGGIPSENGEPMLELAVIKPEKVNHFELGIKSNPIKGIDLNITVYSTHINNYQTNVRSAELGVSRGYLANAEKVQVDGVEIEMYYSSSSFYRINSSLSYNDGRYISFKNAPVPLEETGGADYKDISGETLPGISNWATTVNMELFKTGRFMTKNGEYFFGADIFYRSSFSSSPSASKYLNIDGYSLINSRIGFRSSKGLTTFIWGRNIFDTNYFEQLLPAGGNAGHYAAVLGDPRTYGITLRYSFN